MEIPVRLYRSVRFVVEVKLNNKWFWFGDYCFKSSAEDAVIGIEDRNVQDFRIFSFEDNKYFI